MMKPKNTKRNSLNKFLKFIPALIIMSAAGILTGVMVKTCSEDRPVNLETDHEPNEEVAAESLSIEELYPQVSDSIQQEITTIPIESAFKEEKPEPKKKPIDPRFQYPDGRYKQPSEYMKYFNEDDEDDAYEDGYEDGYDDALDEL